MTLLLTRWYLLEPPLEARTSILNILPPANHAFGRAQYFGMVQGLHMFQGIPIGMDGSKSNHYQIFFIDTSVTVILDPDQTAPYAAE